MDAIRELKNYLARSMPSHMRPSRIIPLERLPLLPGYKVDIEALRCCLQIRWYLALVALETAVANLTSDWEG